MIIRREIFEAVLPAAGDDQHRFYTDHVQVHPDGKVVATDGHICLTAHDPHPFPDEDFPVIPGVDPNGTSPTSPVLLPVSVVKQLLAIMPKKPTIPILACVQIRTNGEGITVAATNLQVPVVVPIKTSVAEITGFPNTERVMVSADRPHVKLILSAQVLKDLLASVQKATRATSLQAVTFEVQTEPAHLEQESIHDHLFMTPLNVSALCITKDTLCERCGTSKEQHDEKRPKLNPQVIDQVRVTYGDSECKVVGVVMPCRI